MSAFFFLSVSRSVQLTLISFKIRIFLCIRKEYSRFVFTALLHPTAHLASTLFHLPLFRFARSTLVVKQAETNMPEAQSVQVFGK